MSEDGRTPVAVLISGRGSNLGALIEAAAAAEFPGRIALVVSNRPEAAGIELARRAGIPVEVVDHRPFGARREAHEAEIDALLDAHGIGLVCLAGYMRRLTPWLVGRWSGRMLNIHPSLLPAFPGLETHRRALEAGVALHGCSVHLVTDGLDDGPILGQAAVGVRADDTEEVLAARVLAAEHALYRSVVARVLDPSAPAGRVPQGMLMSLRAVRGADGPS